MNDRESNLQENNAYSKKYSCNFMNLAATKCTGFNLIDLSAAALRGSSVPQGHSPATPALGYTGTPAHANGI